MIDPDEHRNVHDDDPQLQGRKKPYISPRLTIHGRIEEITALGGTKGTDLPIGSMLF